MATIDAVGAVMIYANDPDGLARWYATRLGIETVADPKSGCHYATIGRECGAGADATGGCGGKTEFAIMPAKGPLVSGGRAVMVNYRVDDIEAFVRQLAEKGVSCERHLESPYGKFAHTVDPEGNPIEIWEPLGKA